MGLLVTWTQLSDMAGWKVPWGSTLPGAALRRPSAGQLLFSLSAILRPDYKNSGMDDPDTDLLLVLVRSLLSPPLASLDQGALLDALLEADGDIERAAAALERGGAGQGSHSSSSTRQAGHKRARSDQGQIESWLDGPKSKRKSVVKASRSSAFATSTSSLPTQRPPQRPDSPTSKAKLAKAVVPLPPLLLANSKLLSDHLPCIAVPPSPLSPRLASALYCVLMDESASWTKNDYVINGLTVQSSHTVRPYLALDICAEQRLEG
jgi:hypothetical protein